MTVPQAAWPDAAALAGWATVDLAELNRRAALLRRVDRKYLVDHHVASALLAELRPAGRVLTIDGAQVFAYATRYLDTPDLVAYHDARRRRPVRWKARVRRYVDTGGAFVELKVRDRRGHVDKRRRPQQAVTVPSDGILGPGDREFLAHAEPALRVPAHDLVPVLDNHYRRLTVLLPDEGSRVTFDLDLSFHAPDSCRATVPHQVMVETKTTGRPCGVDRALWSLGVRPRRFSKYCIGMAVLDADLPANRWHRTLHRVRWEAAHGPACRCRSVASPALDHRSGAEAGR